MVVVAHATVERMERARIEASKMPMVDASVDANATVDRMERARIEASKMPLVDALVDAKELVELVAAPTRRDELEKRRR